MLSVAISMNRTGEGWNSMKKAARATGALNRQMTKKPALGRLPTNLDGGAGGITEREIKSILGKKMDKFK